MKFHTLQTISQFFEISNKNECLIFQWILHDWSDEHCLKLLKNCYKAVPDNGKVIVVEMILPVEPETSSAVKSTFQIDVLMMTQHLGGKERSQQQFLNLTTAAGFSGIRFECFVCNFWVMKFFKQIFAFFHLLEISTLLLCLCFC